MCGKGGDKGERAPMRPEQEKMPKLPLFYVVLPRCE